ncbi:MAG: hypothetical protein ACOC0R_06275 [Mariniphaga sp.]
MKFKIHITRKLVLQLVLFTALAGVAMLVDYYFELHPGTLTELQAGSEEAEKEQSVVYLFSQTSNLSIKSPVQKSTFKKIFEQAHDKYVQKSHQLLDHLAFKAEKKVLRKPLYLTCPNLLFRQHYFTNPDDKPLYS